MVKFSKFKDSNRFLSFLRQNILNTLYSDFFQQNVTGTPKNKMALNECLLRHHHQGTFKSSRVGILKGKVVENFNFLIIQRNINL